MSTIARYRWTSGVFLASFVVRCLLVPITHGPDFEVWDLASQGLLRGINIYAHHPSAYPGGPFAYPPLFLYLELPFQWIAQHSHLPFTVLGKIPIAAGDFLTGTLIAVPVATRTHSDRRAAMASAAYLLNPLVLYNGAFYGRFDAVCAGLFLLALQMHEATDRWSRRSLAVYAAAIATKIYPVFLLPWLWTREPAIRARLAAIVAIVVGGLSLPFLVTAPRSFISDIVIRNLGRSPTDLSWQVVFPHFLSPVVVGFVGLFLLLQFVQVLFYLTEMDARDAALIGILAFFLFSKIVIEQYFVWAIPLLVLNAACSGSRADALLFIVLSIAGMLANHHIHPFGERVIALNVSVAIAILVYVVTRLRHASQRPRSIDCVYVGR